MIATFTIEGPPRTKKTSNQIVQVKYRDKKTGQMRKFTKVLPSEAYRKWFHNAMSRSPIIRTILRDRGIPLPLTGRVHVAAVFYRDADTGDLTGYEQALGDWLQSPQLRPKRNGAGIIIDDKQIKCWDGTHLEIDRANPRIEVTIRALEPQQGGLLT